MHDTHISIAIDGPSGAGKSTLARSIAEKLGYLYMDVTTVLGKKTICISDITTNIRQVQNNSVAIIDVQGNRYAIENLDALDKDTRQKIELYL